MIRRPPRSTRTVTLFPYTTLFRSSRPRSLVRGTESKGSPMPLRVAVQMDPMDKINIAGDSTFAIMLGAQARGHRLFHYAPEDLSYADGRLWTMAHPVTDQDVAGNHYRFEDPVLLDRSEERRVGK